MELFFRYFLGMMKECSSSYMTEEWLKKSKKES